MAIDARRERAYIDRQFDRHVAKVGEAVIWFKFDLTSSYDTVYDEGGRQYLKGIAVPVLSVDEQEANEDYSPDGRRPTNRIHFVVTSPTLDRVGVGAQEAHGSRLFDEKPVGKPWWNDRLNDLIYYSGRFYEVTDFQIRGRIQGTETLVGVSGIETQPSDERVWDLFPAGVI